MEKVRFQVYRYNPDVDAKPYMKDYELEIEPTDDGQDRKSNV